MDNKDFMEEYNSIFERILLFSMVSLREGLCSLEHTIDEQKYNQREIFEYGMRLVMEGKDSELINKILTNIINLETDTEKSMLKTIQKEAILMIQQGIDSKSIMLIINSYVPIELDEAFKNMKKYKSVLLKKL
jgi:flagellar motor component MotA